MADALVQTFQAYPHWATSQRQNRELRRALYRGLFQHGLHEGVTEVVNQIMEVLAKRHE